MLWKFRSVYDLDRLYPHHFMPVEYELRPPLPPVVGKPNKADLYVHTAAAGVAASRAEASAPHAAPHG